MKQRVVVWFSCGASSAVAAKLAVDKYRNSTEYDLHICYCDMLANEHPDNARFLADIEKWLDFKVELLRSDKYTDIYDVFDKTGFLVGLNGARCTTELKKNVRKKYQQVDDIQIFGMTADEEKRIISFMRNNPEVNLEWNLLDARITKQDCIDYLIKSDIQLPVMYLLGYKSNNCIGCVKCGQGYWNKIRVDFPEIFEKMAKQERKMGLTVNKLRKNKQTVKYFLDELNPTAGNYESELEISCGPECGLDEAVNA